MLIRKEDTPLDTPDSALFFRTNRCVSTVAWSGVLYVLRMYEGCVMEFSLEALGVKRENTDPVHPLILSLDEE